MRKYVLIASSVFIFFLSIIVVISKTLVPMIKNASFEKELEKKAEVWQEQIVNVNSEEKVQEEKKFEVKTVPTNDKERVRMYIGKYMEYVNNKSYETAYGLLDEGFKKLNFPTLEDYIKYVDETYKRIKFVDYKKYKIQGFVYVVDTTINDLAIYSNPESFEQIFMFKETEPGKYSLSFGI